MKNRLQFNRIPALFASGVTYLSGTTMGVSGREKATEALEAFVKRRDFIPLIGEPIVVRYIDDKGKKQAMLAIGKATGSTENDTRGIEYHIIDTAKLQEDIDLANEHAAEALDLASAATKDNADYLVILKNMIMSGVGLSDGTYFDNNGRWDRDPSRVGLYAPIENANYIADATSFRDADDKLDKAIKGNADNIEELSAATEDFSGATHTLIDNILAGTGLNTLEPGEYPGHDSTAYIRDAESLDHADVLLDAAIAGTNAWFNGRCDDIQNQLNDEKGYRKALKIVKIDPEKFEELGIGDDVRDAYFLTHHKPNSTEPYEDPQEGDVIIKVYKETVTWDDLEEFSGITESFLRNIIEAEGLNSDGTYDHQRAHDSVNFKDAFNAFEADELLDKAISELSANTTAADQALDNKLNDLSANTMAADQALEEKVAALENTKGADAIKVTMSGSDKTISLALVNGEKVLTQDIYGLKTNIDLYYSKDDKKIYLLGADNNVISEVDASDFIKDGMLDHVNVFVATEEDHREYPQLVVGETYLALFFNTDAVSGGTVSPAFISVKDLVDVYTVSATSLNYLTIKDYEIRANVEDESLPDSLASYKSFKTLCGVTENILAGTGLNTQGTGEYHGHDETHYIKSATSLDNADVKLDEALWALSGVVADMGSGEDLERLSAVTREFSATTDSKFRELSAWTEEIDEVTAGALNDLNRRVGTLETHFTGEYMPLTNYVISEGITEEELLITDEDSVNDAFGKVQKQILDNEETTAAGLNDLNDRLVAAEEEIRHNTGVTALSAAVMSFSAATVNEFNNVHNDITEIEGDITEINNNVNNLSSFTQYLSANSLGMLTVNLNGVEQGKYCPSASTTLNLEAIQEVTGADVLLTGYEISTGTTEEELAIVPTDNVNEAFGKVQKQLYDDEAVTAGALNDLDSRVIDLDERVVELSGVVADDELVVAAALNDLNRRVVEISGNTGVLGDDVLTGVSVDGVAQSVTDHVANIQISIPTVNGFFDGVEYDTNTKRINFYNDTTIVDYVDATDFIKDGMLNNVEVVTVAGETYLRFTFNTDAGKEAIDVKVSDFAALYKAGSGVSITNDNVINLKLANKGDSSYIKLDGDGLYLTGVSTMAGEIQALSAGTLQLSADTHNKIQQLSAATTAISSNLTQLSAATTGIATNLTALSVACVTMSGDVNENRTDIDSLSASLIDDEFVIAAALNDLNRRVAEISGNTGGGGGQTNVQSDWAETDTTSDAYIKNKPYIPKIQKVTTAEYNALTTKDPDTLYILVD